MPKFYTTLALLENSRVRDYYKLYKLIPLGADPRKYEYDPISFPTILEFTGLNDALWALENVPEQKKERDKICRLMAADFAEHVLPIFEKQYSQDMRPLFKEPYLQDTRPRKAIEAARRLAHYDAADVSSEIAAARAAYEAAYDDAVHFVGSHRAANDAHCAAAAARAAYAAIDPRHPACTAAAFVAESAAFATNGSCKDAEREWQTKVFLKYMREGESNV
jgi:hypothetical protein